MKCTQCDNQVKTFGLKTCSLECACKAIGDDYNAVYARMNQAIADGFASVRKKDKRR